VVVLYAALLILLSVPFLLWGWPPRAGLYGFIYNVVANVIGGLEMEFEETQA